MQMCNTFLLTKQYDIGTSHNLEMDQHLLKYVVQVLKYSLDSRLRIK